MRWLERIEQIFDGVLRLIDFAVIGGAAAIAGWAAWWITGDAGVEPFMRLAVCAGVTLAAGALAWLVWSVMKFIGSAL